MQVLTLLLLVASAPPDPAALPSKAAAGLPLHVFSWEEPAPGAGRP